MKEQYANELRRNAKLDPEGWEVRGRWAARRILTAVCFRETAESAFQNTGTILLPTIGFYYALFHMGIAALYLEPTTDCSELREMRHSRLKNLLRARLIQRRSLPDSFIMLLERLQIAREYSNYVLGGKMVGDDDEPIHRHGGADLYARTGAEINHVVEYVRDVSNALAGVADPLSRIAVTIGDDIGDDVYSMYLSPKDKERVLKYLLQHSLTT